MKRLAVRVTGIVQGVGFRPFVYNLALSHGLSGWVLNDGGGVRIEAEGDETALAAFTKELQAKAPPLAVIEGFDTRALPLCGEQGFAIRPSLRAAARSALIAPDIATCADCRREIKDVADRRFGYAFTNCTNCGPRYSIVRDVPYDRAQTTMAEFTMCPACRKEYDDPADRRFHAQPNACPVCGPAYRLWTKERRPVGGDPIRETRRLIRGGAIVAIKGIGGYHLACDALNEAAVRTLRGRKAREAKPLAVMCAGLDEIRRQCRLSPAEEALLTGPARPIALLAKGPGYGLAPAVAPDNPDLGVMLPYTPAHHLLLQPGDVWVMTSGNVSDEPIAYEDEDAWRRLTSIADYYLVHNRAIHCRVDDSVARIFQGRPYLLRRSRGMAPAPIRLAKSGPPVLACGGELKNTFCLAKDRFAFVGAHIGDLENQAAFASYTAAIAHDRRLFDIEPALVAHDLHPEYLSTKYAQSLPLPRIGVQHHHAHIASVLAEHGLDEEVLGVALDGAGYGDDGKLWGGEFFLADCRSYVRLAHCRYLPLPGGAKAVREPWRPAAWILRQLYGPGFSELDTPLAKLLPDGWRLALQAADKGINAPLTSSAGRLFDIAAAILGIRTRIQYEGQAAIELERAAAGAQGAALPYAVTQADGLYELDFRPAFAVLADEARRVGAAVLAASFHAAVAAAVADLAGRLSKETGVRKIALSGGVFQNMTLLRQVVALLEKDFTVYLNRQVPPNDGGLALGQAAVARERSR